MFYIRMAELLICIDNHYDYVRTMCEDYIVFPEDGAKADMNIRVTTDAIRDEQKVGKDTWGINYSMQYCESICIYRDICKRLIDFDALLLHGACIEMDGRAYIFCAKSGTGKSTHIALWKKVFGSRAHIINGDKPIIRYMDNAFVVYGTPWCGKEGWNANTKAPLFALCYLKRGNNNSIRSIRPDEAIRLVVNQILIPKEKDDVIRYLDMVDNLLNSVSGYELICNMDKEAAITAYEGMKH